MKRRLRKKKHIGEFRELGFEISFTFTSPEFPDQFVYDLIEGECLQFGGGGSDGEWSGFVTAERGSVSEPQRMLVERWLKSRAEVVSFSVGSLRDAWYGWDD